MSGSIEKRLTDLEQASGASVCPTCGQGGTIDARNVEFPFIDLGKPQPPPMLCPSCGRPPMSFTVQIGGKPVKAYAGIDDGDTQPQTAGQAGKD
ncbi:MAG: hypothetical protein ABSB74_10065 [Tepidisphaeraceae bacterium]